MKKALVLLSSVLSCIPAVLLAFGGAPPVWIALGALLPVVPATAGYLIARRLDRTVRFLEPRVMPYEDPALSQVAQKRIALTALQSQINPHFLYNTLDSIRGQAMAVGQTGLAAMIEKLSRFFRYSISNQDHIVRLSEEIRYVEDYFFIQKYRFGDKIELRLDLESQDLLECYIPHITLQPIVENSISHGIETIPDKGTIVIHIFATEKKLIIHVEDNGAGMSAEQLEALNARLTNGVNPADRDRSTRHGIAVDNVNARIRLCFGEEYGLHYRSKLLVGTHAEIVLPRVDDFSREFFERRMRELETG